MGCNGNIGALAKFWDVNWTVATWLMIESACERCLVRSWPGLAAEYLFSGLHPSLSTCFRAVLFSIPLISHLVLFYVPY